MGGAAREDSGELLNVFLNVRSHSMRLYWHGIAYDQSSVVQGFETSAGFEISPPRAGMMTTVESIPNLNTKIKGRVCIEISGWGSTSDVRARKAKM